MFDPASVQQDVFVGVKPLMTSFLDGYNVCIFAYGQTGSGKTYTMMGPPEDRGINIRALQELFMIAGERDDVPGEPNIELKVSMLEIYNETIRDLLSGATGLEARLNEDNGILLSSSQHYITPNYQIISCTYCR